MHSYGPICIQQSMSTCSPIRETPAARQRTAQTLLRAKFRVLNDRDKIRPLCTRGIHVLLRIASVYACVIRASINEARQPVDHTVAKAPCARIRCSAMRWRFSTFIALNGLRGRLQRHRGEARGARGSIYGLLYFAAVQHAALLLLPSGVVRTTACVNA